MGRYNIALVLGDGVGPEIASSANIILEKINDNTSVKFNVKAAEAGDGALAKHGKALPELSMEIIKGSHGCLKAPVGESAADVVLVLRRFFDLYANVRPAKSYPSVEKLSDGVDLVLIRENTEDLYVGWEFEADDNTVISLRLTSKRASERIARYAFEEAKLRDNKKRVVAVHKSNVLRMSDGLFARTCRAVSQNYPDISYNESYVDACAMNLIRNPDEFDVILTSNLYGDILSDEAAQVIGGLGLAPCANIGESFGLFEPVHGAAFDIAGKNLVNPSGMLLSIKMLLEWLSNKHGDKDAFRTGQHLESCLVEMFRNNQTTKDLGGKLTTSEFTKLLSLSMY